MVKEAKPIKTNLIYRGDCYSTLKRNFPAGKDEKGMDLIYLDPPFSRDPKYARLWYDKETLKMFEEMWKGGPKHFVGWMSKRLEQCHRVLKNTGSVYLHCDWKFEHYLKIEMDNIFGRNNFQGDIVWWYHWGVHTKKRWNRKHDNLLFYTKSDKWIFNADEVREPYEGAGGMAQDKKWNKSYDIRGRLPEDVWYIPTINAMSRERVGYPTQKPLSLLERIIKASSNKGEIVLDPMCGCGTTIVAAHKLKRRWIGIDISSQACEVMKKRMEKLEDIADVPVIGLPLTIRDLKKLSPFEFQDYICEMTNSEKTKHVADMGIDGYYLGETPLQVKQQEGVGRNAVDNFETALRRKNKDKGYIAGFSFTKGAYEEAARAKADDRLDIQLVELNELITRDYELEKKEE